MDKDSTINPKHYQSKVGNSEVIDIIEFYNLNFHRGNVLKYVLRAGSKQERGYSDIEKEIEDLEKASWYITREIKRIKNANVERST